MDDRDGDGEPRAVDALGWVDDPPAVQDDLVPSGADPLVGDQPIWRRTCHVCLLPSEYADELARLRFRVGTGGPKSLAGIAHRISEMLEADGVTSLTITKSKLSIHFRHHAADDQRTAYQVQVASRTGRPPGIPRGMPSQLVHALPAPLDPTTPAGRIADGLAAIIESTETVLERVELFLDGVIPLPDMTVKEAIAAHGYLASVLRQHYWTLHRVGDPKAALARFRLEVARAMMHDVIASASKWFGELAQAMPEGRDRAQLRSEVLHHGRSFAASLDEISRRYDGVLAAMEDES